MSIVPKLRLTLPTAGAGAVRRAVLTALFVYAGPAAFVTAVAAWGLGAHRANWHVPFEYNGDDTLLIYPMIQGAAETGSFWRHDRMGAPGTLYLADFPVVDAWHFAALRVLLRIDPDPVWAFNAYHLLTYPLAALVATACLRRLGLSAPAAVAVGILYAFAPFHLSRGLHHYFLSAYYLLPLPLTLAVRFALGWSPFANAEGRFRWRSGPALGALAIGLATSAGGAYYAFFSCVVLAIAGLIAAFRPGRRGTVAAGLTVAAVVAGGLALHAPSVAHAAAHGHNEGAHARVTWQCDWYGLALMQLVLPAPDHRSPALARLRAVYDGDERPGVNLPESAALGAVAAAGWVGLIVVALVPGVGPAPVRAMAALTVGVSLIAVTGGGGSLFNYLVSSQVRVYARFAIVLAFFALAAVGFAFDRFAPGRFKLLTAGLLVAFGLWDQTPRSWFSVATATQTSTREAQFSADRAFFAGLEAALPPEGMVFQLPYAPYPESHYHHVRGVVHTTALRFSFGAMKHRAVDEWVRTTATRPTEEMLDRLALRDFVALCVFCPFLLPEERERLDALTARLGPGNADATGTHVWFDLRPWRDALRTRLGPAEFERRATDDREAIAVEWLGAFSSDEPFGAEWRHRRCERTGEIHFVNPTDRPRRVRVTARFATHGPYRATLALTGFGLTAAGRPWHDRFDLSPEPVPFDATFDLPPGRSGVKIKCDVPKPPPRFPHEPDRFSVYEFRVEEVP